MYYTYMFAFCLSPPLEKKQIGSRDFIFFAAIFPTPRILPDIQ